MPRCSRSLLDVGDQVPGGVRFQRRVGRALAAAALVEVHDAVLFRVEEAPLFGIGAAARTAVQKDHRLAGGVAAFLEVDLVDRRDLEPARVVGLDGRVEPGDGIFHDGCGQRVVGHREQYNSPTASKGRHAANRELCAASCPRGTNADPRAGRPSTVVKFARMIA